MTTVVSLPLTAIDVIPAPVMALNAYSVYKGRVSGVSVNEGARTYRLGTARIEVRSHVIVRSQSYIENRTYSSFRGEDCQVTAGRVPLMSAQLLHVPSDSPIVGSPGHC